ncbi:MAG: methionyl-tRNA formyltransferase [Chloroflexota bacterium]
MTDGRADGSRVRTVFLGSGGFGVGALRALGAHPDLDVVGVVTAPPRPAGRNKRLTPTPVEAAAPAMGIETILTPERLRTPEAIASVLALDPELAVLADYGQIVPPELLALRYGALNVHPSLLPRHRGATPIPAAILAGDAETGVTLMQMNAGLDTGPILAQRTHTLDGTETTPTLEAALAQEVAELLASEVGPWIAGETIARPQPLDGVTMTRPLRREDGRLDPTRPAVELERQVRAYQPWPSSFIDTVAGRVAIWRAHDIGIPADGQTMTPGRIRASGMDAGDQAFLAFDEVQPAGGRRMAWRDFVRGHPAIVDSEIVPGP